MICIYVNDRNELLSSFSPNISDALFVKAELALIKIINMALDNELSSLSLDSTANFGTTYQGLINRAFGNLMINLYDILIQHLWIVEFEEAKQNNELDFIYFLSIAYFIYCLF